MEQHEKHIIRTNLDNLIKNTCCSSLLIASLTAKGVLDESDRASLKSVRNEMDQSMELYEILMKKSNSFRFLLEALENTNQSGAVSILKRSLVQTTIEPLTDAIKFKTGIRFDFIPPIHNFSGRKMELQDLHDKLTDSEIRAQNSINLVSVVGLGGVGKTELCRKYAEQYLDYFDGNVVWISATSKDVIQNRFCSLAEHHLQLCSKEKDIQIVVDEVYKVFVEQKCLFVFDNAECTHYMQIFLPLRVRTSAHVLITSRDKDWDFTKVFILNELRESDATEFVKNCLGIIANVNHEFERVNALVETLQCLPLALQQCVAFINQRQRVINFDILDYLKLFETNSKTLLSSKIPPSVFGCSTETTYTTWRITTNAIECDTENGELAMHILHIISYFAPDNIPLEILTGLEVHDKQAIFFAIDLLVKYSMVSRRQKYGTVSIHRLVQQVTRENLKEQGKEIHTLRIALNLFKGCLNNDTFIHATVAYYKAIQYEELIIEFRSLPCVMLQAHGQNFMYEQAKYLKDVSLENLKKCLPTNHIDIIRTELYWAVIEYIYCNYDTALERFQRLENYLLHEARETFPREKACLKYYTASTQLKLENKSTGSLTLAKESWIACNSIFGENKTETINSMQLVALSLENIGSCREALSIYRHCIKLYRNNVANSYANSSEILLTMQNLAGLYIKMDKIDKAIQTARNILKKSRKDLYKIDIRFSETGNHLAYCFTIKHQYVIATRIAIDVYNFRKEVYGSENLKTLITLKTLANLKCSMLRSEEALLIYEYVHTKFSEKFGKFHVKTLNEKCNIAITYSVSGMHDDAIEIFQEIFLLFKDSHAPDDYFHLSQVQYQYGKAYMRMRKPKEALDIFVDLETQLKTRFGEKHYLLTEIRKKISYLQNVIQANSLLNTLEGASMDDF